MSIAIGDMLQYGTDMQNLSPRKLKGSSDFANGAGTISQGVIVQ